MGRDREDADQPLERPAISPGGQSSGLAGEALDLRFGELVEAQRLAGLGSWRWSCGPDRFFWSDELREVLGRGAGPAMTPIAALFDSVHPQDRGPTRAAFEAAMEDRHPLDHRCRIVQPSGAVQYCRWRSRPQGEGHGVVTELRGICQDITERASLEEALLESADHYRYAVELNPQIPWSAGPDGKVLEVSRRWLVMMGMEEADTLGDGWIDALHPDDLSQTLDAWERSLTTGLPLDLEYRLRLRDGSYQWMRVRAAARFNPDGSVIRWYGTVEDIRDRKLAEKALADSEERLRLAIESTGLGLWDVDFQSHGEWWSEAKRAILGVAADHPAGIGTLREAMHPADRAHFESRLERALDPNGDHRLGAEMRIRRKSDGEERWVATSGKVLFGPDGKPQRIIGTFADITDRQLAEEAVRSSEERFRNITATSPDACICVDADGRITFWNEAAERIFGFAAAEALGAPIDIIVPEHLYATYRRRLRKAASGRGEGAGRSAEFTACHRAGHEFPVEVSLSSWMQGGRRSFGALIRDISERTRQRQALFRLAHYDQLTGLPNRTLLWQSITAAVAGGRAAAVMLVDLDGFKDVNDSLGHDAGDQLLGRVAERLVQTMPPEACVGRFGGDEFAVCVPGIDDPSLANRVADQLRERLCAPFVINGHTAYLGASVGIAIGPFDGTSAEELMVNADLALYQAKADGRNVNRIFSPRLREARLERRSLEVELRRALSEREFELHFQPQVTLKERRMVGTEALLRWRHETRGLLSPAAFLPVLEAGPLAAAVGDWVIQSACREAARLRDGGLDLRVGVNLFAAQFRDDDLVDLVGRTLAETGLPPDLLELEITETTILRGDEAILATLRRLRDLGVGIAFDDYGTGYASLSMLKRFPLTRLKIDKGFVRNLATDTGDFAIVDAVLRLGERFGLKVIAEGVETQEQEEILISLGCNEGQGYLYGRPAPAEEILPLLAAVRASA